MEKRPTIYDIAAAAGVSRQTVTRAMNDMADISPETRRRVLEVSEQLGYRRSRFATNLVRQQSFTVGFMVNTFRNPYYSELTAAMLDAATAQGWQLALYSREHIASPDFVERVLSEVDAIAGYFYGQEEWAFSEAARGVPVVALERPSANPGVHSVEIDWTTGMQQLIDGLLERGSRQFAMLEILGGVSRKDPSRRRAAFVGTVDPASAERIVTLEDNGQSLRSGALGMRELQSRYPEVDTVIAFSDLMAMGAMQAVHEQGLDVPGDVRIVGIDGLSLDIVTSPPLTSLAIDRSAVADRVVEIISMLREDPTTPPMHTVLAPQPVWRGSA